MSIKLWDWDKKWQCTQTFEGHTHYVMQVVFNPKDNNTFASASLDRTIKVSFLTKNSRRNKKFEKKFEKTFLIPTFDWLIDWLIQNSKKHVLFFLFCHKLEICFSSSCQVWQLGSAQPNYTLEGHEKGVNAIDYYHGGDKPYLMSGADDRLVKIWDYQVNENSFPFPAFFDVIGGFVCPDRTKTACKHCRAMPRTFPPSHSTRICPSFSRGLKMVKWGP